MVSPSRPIVSTNASSSAHQRPTVYQLILVKLPHHGRKLRRTPALTCLG